MAKKAKNLTLSVYIIELLEAVSNGSKLSVSDLVEAAVLKTYQDPIKRIEEEMRRLAIEQSRVTARLKELSKEKDEIKEKQSREKKLIEVPNYGN